MATALKILNFAFRPLSDESQGADDGVLDLDEEEETEDEDGEGVSENKDKDESEETNEE